MTTAHSIHEDYSALQPIRGGTVSMDSIIKHYGSFTAVDGVNLSVGRGEFVALLGPSGSGKTTLLMMIAGFEHPDSGAVCIDGVDVSRMPAHRRDVGMVFQKYALFPHMTILDNVAFPLRMRGVTTGERRLKALDALRAVGLEGMEKRLPAQLSGGQQQRVALARAIVYRPPVLLMDEPLGALDKKLRERMQIEIKHLQESLGATVIYVTHDQEEALTMADRIAVMNRGRLEQVGTPAELYERPANPFVASFVGETNLLDGELVATAGKEWTVRLAGAAPGQNNMYKAALHELGHVLGFGTAESWFTRVSGSSFNGPASAQRYGGPVPLDAAGSSAGHWRQGTLDGGAPTIMDPFVSGSTFTALDFAGLADVGWELAPAPAPATARAFAVGAGQGSAPHVKVFNPDGAERLSFYAYDAGYVGGVRVAPADVTGDGFDDVITGTTPGTANGHVKVFDGRTGAEVRSFYSMPGATSGIFVAGGDTNGDGKAEVIVGADAGVDGGQILVFDGATGTLLADFRAFASPFLGGVRVAAGDVTGDGRADVIAGSGFGSTPHVKVFSGDGFAEVLSFFAYAPGFQGGVFVSAGDFDGDGVDEVVTSAGDIPHLRVVDARAFAVRPGGEVADSALRTSFIIPGVQEAGLRGGPVAALDRTGDGRAELLAELTGAPSSRVRTLDAASAAALDELAPFPGFQGAIFVG